MHCPKCNSHFSSGFKFCGNCGTQLVDQTTQRAATGEEAAERRHLTVLFCDLVGSTQLSERLDPEDLQVLLQAYHDTCGEVITKFGGHIAQYLGDGLLVYFGFPQAHEDDALRAVHAGLGICRALDRLNLRLRRDEGVELAVRVGIHAGPVVTSEVGSGSRKEQLALGQTPNVAARVQGLAEPGTVYLSAAIRDLIGGFFICRSLGPQPIKGISAAMEVFQVLAESDNRSWFDAIASQGLTPLVGRQAEFSTLARCFERARRGSGQIVLLSGDAGIGKSRLIHNLRIRLQSPKPAWLLAQCSPYHRNTALRPLIGLVGELLGLADDGAADPLARLERSLEALGCDLSDAVPLLAQLLSVPLDDRYPPSSDTSQLQKKHTLELVADLLQQLSARRPVVVIIEDLHWIDPSTLEFLGVMFERLAQSHLMVVLSFRPSFEPNFPSPGDLKGRMTLLDLQHLEASQVAELAQQIAGQMSLPEPILQQLVERSDGVPLYVEEMTKTVLSAGLLQQGTNGWELVGPLPPMAIPASLHGSLMARLDRLPRAKEIAQLGAVLGRDFSFELISALSGLDDEALRAELNHLTEAELLYRQEGHPQPRYVFKHALLQEVAYDALLIRSRQKIHRRVAKLLEDRFSETVTQEPELVAHHYTRGDRGDTALKYWQLAGEQAIDRGANVEAVEHLRVGLEVLAGLPESNDRDIQELPLQLKFGAALMTIRGYGAPEVEAAYARSYELSEQLDDASHLFEIVLGLWIFYVMRGRYEQALVLGQRLLRLAEAADNATLLVQACHSVGFTRLSVGQLSGAREVFERGLATAEQDIASNGPQIYRSPSGDDIRIHILSHLALTLWHLGYPQLASERGQQAVQMAEEGGHPFGRAYALTMSAWLYQILEDWPNARAMVHQALAVSSNKAFGWWQILGGFLQGLLMTLKSDSSDDGEVAQSALGLQQMEATLKAFTAAGVGNSKTYLMFLLAEAYRRHGQVERSLEVLNDGLDTVSTVGEKVWGCECYRLKAELLQQSNGHVSQGPNPNDGDEGVDEVDSWLQKSLSAARQYGTRSLELRAALSLARWRRQHERTDEARELLQERCDLFPEDGEPPDLRRARAFLEELR